MSREDFLDALDFEIVRHRHDNRRPGWTPWALWGSLSVLVWMFLEALVPERTSSVIALVLSFELLYFALTVVAWQFSTNPKNLLGIRRFRTTRTQFLAYRYSAAIGTAVFTVFTYLAYSLDNVNIVLRLFTASEFVAAALLNAFLLGVLASPQSSDIFVAVHKTLSSRGWRLVGSTVAGTVLFAGVPIVTATLLIQAASIPSGNLVERIQTALLAFGIVRILFRLGATAVQDPILLALCDLRTEVARHRISVNTATPLFDGLVGCMTTSQVIQRNNAEVAERITHATLILNRVSDRISCILSSDDELLDMDSKIRRAVLDALEIDMGEVRTAVARVWQLQTRAMRIGTGIMKQGGEPEAAASAIAELRSLSEAMDKEYEKIGKRLELAKRLVEQVDSNADDKSSVGTESRT